MTDTQKDLTQARREAMQKIAEALKVTYDAQTGEAKPAKNSEIPKKPVFETQDAAQALREERFRAICERMMDLYHRKNLDYGNAFGESLKEFGLTAAVVRIGDKYRRIKALTTRKNEVADESVRDTLMDMANYAIMTLIELEKP